MECRPDPLHTGYRHRAGNEIQPDCGLGSLQRGKYVNSSRLSVLLTSCENALYNSETPDSNNNFSYNHMVSDTLLVFPAMHQSHPTIIDPCHHANGSPYDNAKRRALD